jgi:hypothetical protein
MRSESGPRGRICSPLPGGSGHRPAGIRTGLRGARCTGRRGMRGNARITPPSREARPEPRPIGGNPAERQSRSGAPRGERAPSLPSPARGGGRRKARCRASQARTMDGCAFRRSAPFVFCSGRTHQTKLGRVSAARTDFFFVIASAAKQSSAAAPFWIASSLRSSQRRWSRPRGKAIISPLPACGESIGALRTPFLMLRTPMRSIGYVTRG